MSGKLIVLGVFVLIVLVVLVIMQGSELSKKMAKSGKKAGAKVKEIKEKKEVEILDGPEISVKPPGAKKYHSVKMRKKEFLISNGGKRNPDLVLEDPKVEGCHAVIKKRISDNRVWFELINYAKTNPTEYYNPAKKRYEYLSYKEAQELGPREYFCMGETKICIRIPESKITPPTELIKGKDQATDKESFAGKEKINRSPSERVINAADFPL